MARDQASVSCKSCHKPQSLQYTESQIRDNVVDRCVVCAQGDFYVRDDARKALGLLYLAAGLAAAYFTYGISLILGAVGFYWYSVRYSKLTICYHCYAKYRNCKVNPEHKEYDSTLVEEFERAIRNDRQLKHFQ